MSRQERRSYLVLAVLAALPLFQLLIEDGNLLVWPGADVSDLVTAHLPISTFIHQSLVRWGQIPLWNPTILSGMPILGDPLAGLAYPPLWLTYWLPSSYAYHFLFWLHLSWAGVGTYRLGRAAGMEKMPALLSGAALALSPRLLGQWGLGHATLVFAFCWTPWVLAALHRSVECFSANSHQGWFWWAISGGSLGILASADPRWAPPAGLLALAYTSYQLLVIRKRLAWRPKLAGPLVSLAALLGSLAFMALPLFQLLAGSQRASMTLQSIQVSAMPATALVQLVTPNPSAWPEWGAAVGAGILLLAVLTLKSKADSWFWWAVILFSVLLSLGPATPLWRLVTSVVPGLGQLRMPGRWFLLASLAFALLAGYGLQSVSSSIKDQERRRINLTAVGAGALVIMLAAARGFALGSLQTAAAQAAIASGVVAVFIVLLVLGRPYRFHSGAIFILLICAELTFLSVKGFDVRNVNGDSPSRLAAELPTGFGNGRVFSPSYSLSQLTAAQANLEMANGVHPLQLRSYRQFMAEAVGFDPDQYSVILPPLPEGEPASEAQFNLNLEQLSLLNVTHVVSAVPQQLEGLTEVGTVNERWLYEVEEPQPRAWLQPNEASGIGEVRGVDLDVWSPNRLELSAVGPGLLVLSEVYNPIWSVMVDGSAAQLEPYAGILRAVPLPAGEHHVIFQARPGAAWVGLIITTFTWLLIGILWWKQ